jgi:peptidoglycan lytic transglycosylase
MIGLRAVMPQGENGLSGRLISVWGMTAVLAAGVCLAGAGHARADILSPGDKKIYTAAFAAVEKGDWKLASRDAARGRDPLAAEALEWVGIVHGGYSGGFTEITRFIADHPDWPDQTALEQRAEEAMAGVPDDQLNAWFTQHPPVTAAGRLRQAALWMAAGRPDAAKDLIRQVWIGSDFTRFDEHSMLQRYHHVLRTEDHEKRLDRLLWDDQKSAAHRMFPLVPAGARMAAQTRIALASLMSNVESLVARVPPEYRHGLGFIYDRVQWRRRKNLDDGAIELLADVPPDPAHAAQWANERQILARWALSAGHPETALRLAEHQDTSGGPSFAELEFLSGWIALRYRNEPNVAYEHFVRLYDAMKLPITLARGAYWAGRAAEAMGFQQLAAAWYDTAAERVTTYYGQLAAVQRGNVPDAVMPEPIPTAAETATFNNRELVRVTRILGEAGADEAKTPFVRHLSDTAATPDGQMLVTLLALEIGRPDLAVDAAKRASYAGINLIAEGYPIPAMPAGGKVETPLLLAMTRQESAFDHKAVSRVGARGLMQLMPKTARLIAKALRLPFSRKRLTTDKHYNVTLGRAYLDGLLADFSGSYVLAIAAYNAGPARVKDWINQNGDPRSPGVDVIDWIELIPYSETRNYVQRVLENLQIYRMRMGETGPAFTIASDLRR